MSIRRRNRWILRLQRMTIDGGQHFGVGAIGANCRLCNQERRLKRNLIWGIRVRDESGVVIYMDF